MLCMSEQVPLPLPLPLVLWCRGGSVRNLPLINPELKAKKKAKYNNSGILSFESVKSVGCVCVCVRVCVCACARARVCVH